VSRSYHYKKLSGGEKDAFDLLLDFIVKSESFDATVFCIDEPDLHMHTRLQASLLEELYRQLPTNCQLWVATHSIGMTRRAMDLHRASPSEVVFLDFGDRDIDYPQEMAPASVDRTFWKRVFGVALDDIAELVTPSEIVPAEVADLKTEGIKVLRQRDLKNYLWDDEVLTKLCAVHNWAAAAAVLIAEKQSLLGEAEANGKPANDIKWISGRLYNEAKKHLSLTGCGNNATTFARDSLAPLITSGMAVYSELEDVFGP
jgi:hypothetical protein